MGSEWIYLFAFSDYTTYSSSKTGMFLYGHTKKEFAIKKKTELTFTVIFFCCQALNLFYNKVYKNIRNMEMIPQKKKKNSVFSELLMGVRVSSCFQALY